MSGNICNSSSSPISLKSSLSSNPSPRKTSIGVSTGNTKHRSLPLASVNRRRSVHNNLLFVSGSSTSTNGSAGAISAFS